MTTENKTKRKTLESFPTFLAKVNFMKKYSAVLRIQFDFDKIPLSKDIKLRKQES